VEHALSPLPAAVDPLCHVVLVEPQIPANTGNAARTCAAVGATLHLVGTLGFTMGDAALRRAGLDYWPAVDLHWHPTLADLREVLGPGPSWHLFTARARTLHVEAQFARGDVLVFGREDLGLPDHVLHAHPDRWVRIPIRRAVRSLNLSTCVGIAAYEVLRQVAARSVP
jgi:tRNA (cytidine/uridine-2'-O-)-methyltransferase